MLQPTNLITSPIFMLLAILSLNHVWVDCSAIQGGDSLYHSNDKVIILTTNNFTKFVVDLHQDGQKLQLIQFYNSWCGHCIAFAPKFKKFVKSVEKWKELISISVVDCSLDVNRKVCTDHNIMYYPTLRMFWFKPKASDHGEDVKLKGHEVPEVRATVLKWISDNWKLGNIPDHWPQFAALTADNKQELIGKLNLDHDNRTIVIVVEKDASNLGREIMMDLSRYTSQVRLFRMEESSIRLLDQILPQSLDTFKLPFLMTVNNRDRKFNVMLKPLMSKQEDLAFFTKMIKEEFVKNALPELDENDQNDSVEVQVSDGKKIKYSSRVYMSDLNNAVRFALFHEVPMRKHLTVDQTNALIRFLIVLHDNLHFQNDKTKQFVKYLHDYLVKKLNDLNRASMSGSPAKLEVEDMLTTMNMYEEYYHFPEMKQWRACADVAGGPKRSYPCSLWSLFHVLTVAEYRRSLQLKQWSSLHSTIYAMREYIRNFFGCSECAQHFVSMASGLENELAYPNSSVLWLWHAHNKVNARLKGSASETIQIPKRQFPTHEECPHCYRTLPDESSFSNATIYRAHFDEPKLLQFLVEFYAAERIVPDKSEFDGGDAQKDALVIGDDLKRSQSLVDNGSGSGQKHRRKNLINYVPFNNTDYSLMLIFYLLMLALMFTICALFRLRRNRNNRKSFLP